VVAVRMAELGAALARLDAGDRELLEHSLRAGRPDDEVAGELGIDAAQVAPRREALLARLAAELRLDGRMENDELRATLPDLPDRLWRAG
jgi:hypothetical protein